MKKLLIALALFLSIDATAQKIRYYLNGDMNQLIPTTVKKPKIDVDVWTEKNLNQSEVKITVSPEFENYLYQNGYKDLSEIPYKEFFIYCEAIDGVITLSAVNVKKVSKITFITIANENWNCGSGYNPRKIKVTDKGLIYFDWLGDDVKSWKSLSEAKKYWKWEGTEIKKINFLEIKK